MISASGAYSRLERPGASNSKVSSSLGAPEWGGMNRFHNPSAFALAFSSSMIAGTCQRLAPKSAICRS